MAAATATASATATITVTEPEEQPASKSTSTIILKVKPQKKIVWCEDTVDNEHMCKKSSKRCCIFHKQKQFGESDSDESASDIEEAEKAEPKEGAPKPYQRFHA